MKIAVVAPTHLPARRANTLQVMKMAQAMVSLGHQVRLAAPAGPVPGPQPGWEDLAIHYGLQHEFPVEWLPARPQWRRYDYGYAAVRWAQRQGADLLYTRLPQAAAIGSASGLATILEVHDLPQGVLGPWLFRRFLKGRGACRLVVITHSLAADLTARLAAPPSRSFTLVAPDGVDLERYQGLPGPEEARRSPRLADRLPAGRLPAERFTAGYTGHLYAGRGAELILALAAQLPEITFLLAGGEPGQVAQLQADVAAQGLGNVVLTGFVPNAELPAYQAACDVLLMPYQRQVAASSGGDIGRYLSPMKLFEYLACGRAILSSDLPVLREVLSPENALLLPPEQPAAWVAALRRLQAEPHTRQRLADQARQDAGRYTWEARAERILAGLDR